MWLTKTSMIQKMPGWEGTLWSTVVRLQHQVSCRAAERSQLLSTTPAELHQRFDLLSKSPADLCICLTRSYIWLSNNSTLRASWMHLHNFWCFQGHLGILLQCLSTHCSAPGRPGSIWKYLEALVRSTRVSRRFVWPSAKFESVWMPHTYLPDVPVNLTSALNLSQMLPDSPGGKPSALRLIKSIPRCSWDHWQL